MKNVSKKVLCLLSSAVLLCGATAMTTNAAPDYATLKPGVSTQKSSFEFRLKNNNFEITPSETATLEVGLYGSLSGTLKPGRKTFIPIPAKLKKLVRFQWYNEKGIIQGATGVTYEASSAGKYYCRVINKAFLDKNEDFNVGSGKRPLDPANELDFIYLDSNIATVSVCEELSISKQPVGGTIADPNAGYTLSVGAKGGSAPYTYTWYKDGAVYGTGADLNTKEQGYYYCVVKDKKGRTVTSKTVYVSDFRLVRDLPSLANTKANTNETFTVEVSGGTGRYMYVWQYSDIGVNSWTTIRNATTTSTSYSLNLNLMPYAGKKIRCIIYSLNDSNGIASLLVTRDLNISEPLKSDYIDCYYGENGKLYCREKITGGFGNYTFRGDVQITNWYETGTLEWWFDEETSILTYDNHMGSYSVHVWDEIGNHLRICPIN